MSVAIGLTCFHCGKTVYVEAPHLPQFAFEVAAWANDVGMRGVMDRYRGRALVFCNAECEVEEMTTKGTYRARPKGPKKEAQ